MKKIIVSCVTAGLILAGGGQAFAMDGEQTTAQTPFNFGQKVVSHEDMSVQQIKEMYLKHHGTLGAFSSANFEMNNDCMK